MTVAPFHDPAAAQRTLCAEFDALCLQQGIPRLPGDDPMLLNLLNSAQRRWFTAFVARWDAATEPRPEASGVRDFAMLRFPEMYGAAPPSPQQAVAGLPPFSELARLTHWLDAKYARHKEIEDDEASKLLHVLWRSAFAQHAVSEPAAVPTGFWLAPMEPDEKMLKAGDKARGFADDDRDREALTLNTLSTWCEMRDSWLSRHPQQAVEAPQQETPRG